MKTGDWAKLWHNSQLDIESYQAVCVEKRFPAHIHDHYVICIIDRGYQTFTHRKRFHRTSPGDIILLNPGDDHTGEPADNSGFEYRALYPGLKHFQEALSELTEKHPQSVNFTKLIINDNTLSCLLRDLHRSLTEQSTAIEQEIFFINVLNSILARYTDMQHSILQPKKEKATVKKACNFIHDHLNENITLTDIADNVGLSRYYLLRTFHEEKGISPHAYMESLRICKSKVLLAKGTPLIQVAMDLGYTDQSHFTNTFKRVMGITPGQYVKSISS